MCDRFECILHESQTVFHCHTCLHAGCIVQCSVWLLNTAVVIYYTYFVFFLNFYTNCSCIVFCEF